MFGAGGGILVPTASIGQPCSIMFVSCIVFPPKMEIGRAATRSSGGLPIRLCRFRPLGAQSPQKLSSVQVGN